MAGEAPFSSNTYLSSCLKATFPIPGRFSNLIQKTINARHSRQVIREDMTSSFVLNLDRDGVASACRGWRYSFVNDGPHVHTEERIREQLGYRGTWKPKSGWLHLNIRLDDAICSRIGEYGHLVPNHSREWRLRCLSIVPEDHHNLIEPIIACQSINKVLTFGEEEPHMVSGILPGRWIVLGAGNGLRIKITTSSLDGGNLPGIRVEPSPEPVLTSAWKRAF